MKTFFWTILTLLVSIPVVGQTNSWKGLIPLRSTREQVEKLFGQPNPKEIKYKNEYKVGDDTLWVEYSQKPCDEGWDVPLGTVLSFAVADGQQTNKSEQELKLDRKNFFITRDDAMYGTWTEPILGIQYYFTNVGMSLNSVGYIPRREQNNLRCDGFPPYVPEAYYYTMDTYDFYDPKRDKEDDKFYPAMRVAGSSVPVLKNPLYRTYVLIYFDAKLSLKEYRKRITFLKSWIYPRLKASQDDIVVIEGGMREENKMEIYTLPKDRKPPAPKPTLPSPQFLRPKSVKPATSLKK